MNSSSEIRQSFRQFFEERGHRPVASAPLVPQGDPTLLFTNAGMVQFKDYFLGLTTPPFRRAVTVQKCLRVSGKHNDLENVGPSARHHTFFEMLGNFSFGDYFKEDAIRFGWELVTEVWGLPAERLFATVFEEDDEAEDLWRRISGLPAGRVHRCGKEDNFWAMGETGPCGPSSEIFVDLEPQRPAVAWEEGTESGRYLEIWNLVFMQFDRDAEGVLTPLPNPSIDTGAGLERVAAVLEGVGSNYDTDLFRPLLRSAAELAGTTYGKESSADVSLRVIADHLRAVAFLLADGVIPANDGRGYVLRRILRRAVRHGMRLGLEGPFLGGLLGVLGEIMGAAYPELEATRAASAATIHAEEEKFLNTIAIGARQVQQAVEEARARGSSVLAGDDVFRLYDTYGLPLEAVREIAEEERLSLDEGGFERALGEQRRRSRAAASDSQRQLAELRAAVHAEGELDATKFEGYDELEVSGATAQRLVVAAGKDGGWRSADSLAEGQEGVLITDRTPFYGEGGGQVGDQGLARWEGGVARVIDTQKDAAGVFYHFLLIEQGELKIGQRVDLEVDEVTRRATERNHTATHLLQAALREVLGKGVRQAGSLVAPDRLRFDFTYGAPLTPAELTAIEDRVNAQVLRAVPTRIEWTGYQEAVAEGAMALFGEKYGDRVRTVMVPGFSLELCGGCHVRNTGEIGQARILSERGIASGVRRIEALTGTGALEHERRRDSLLHGIEGRLGAPADRLEEEISALQDHAKDVESQIAQLRMRMVAGKSASGDEVEIGEVKAVVREVPPAPPGELRSMADVLRERLGSGLVVLGTREDGKVTLVVAVTSDLLDRLNAGRVAHRLAALAGGGGGGRADFAQAGGRDPDKLPEVLAAVPQIVTEEMAS